MPSPTSMDEAAESVLRALVVHQSSVPGTGGLKHRVVSEGLRFVLSSQVWINALPTTHCDVLITLQSGQTDRDEDLERLAREVLALIRRKDNRILGTVRKHYFANTYGLYFTARYSTLLRGAEILQLQKKVWEEYGGGWRPFVYRDKELFEGYDDKRYFLSSLERSVIVWKLLQSCRADMDVVNGISLCEGQLVIPALKSCGVFAQILPLHCQDELRELSRSWVTNFTARQPLDSICRYFGVHIAMYFAWLGHYTTALTIPALLGAVHWFWHTSRFGSRGVDGADPGSSDYAVMSFAIVNILWATLYLESWKRKQAELAYRWGTLGMERDLLVDPRPEFQGICVKSRVTGRTEIYYPPWRRRMFRYLLSYPITLACIGIMFAIMLGIFRIQEWCDGSVAKMSWMSWISFLPKIFLAVVISVADDLYGKLAIWLNDQENYRTDDSYEDHLIMKMVVFQFVNSFLSLFYIAFYLKDMNRLSSQLATLLITRQVIGNFKEAVLPLLLEKLKLSRMSYTMTRNLSARSLQEHVDTLRQKRHLLRHADTSSFDEELELESLRFRASGSSEGPSHRSPDDQAHPSPFRITQAEVESMLPQYSSPLGDYLEMYIQFGYVLLFSPAFPLAALCALVNNVLEIHVDSFKLCTTFQRPFGKRVENVGSWQIAMEAMGVLGVMVNCALIGQFGLVQRFWPGLSSIGQIMVIVALEHIILAIKFTITEAIPDVPHWVTVEMSKVEFRRREAVRRLEQMKEKHYKRAGSADFVTHF